ncbi:hypothetical protein BGZ65_002611 [Modicella reniformis]|uniref:Uncharacterized protein n=1 Tax=Modicella reniformis TaxID=1440133 RepID=A0A9P6SMF2_9FUNG|nr:hypothetical protein BGZ65_002611 [Modicella reniformis]
MKGSTNIPLGIPQEELAKNIHGAIRQHFSRIFRLIVDKMKKVGIPEDTIPPQSCDEDNDDDVDDDDIDDDPAPTSPTSPIAGYRDTFHELRETALVTDSLGNSFDKDDTHPTKAILNTIFSRSAADQMANQEYGSILKLLFVGDKEEIRNYKHKAQTTYGKRATTMNQFRDQVPETSRVRIASPPTMRRPTNIKSRYALSTYLVTNGLQVNLQTFDVTMGRTSSKSNPQIMDIKKRFPDRGSIIEAFGEDYNNAIVCGVDPGEVVSASFCCLDPKKKDQASNLIVKRSALYQPVFKYRSEVE